VEDRGLPAYIAEFLGTLVLVFAIVMVLTLHGDTIVVVGLVHVFVLAILVASLGGSSGAHFNPAVTAALAALRKIRPADAAVYVVMQLAGAVAGVAIAKLILSDEVSAAHYGANLRGSLISGSTPLAFLCEALGTFMLMWAIMAAAVNPRAAGGLAPWIIGGALGLAVMLFGPITTAGFNPARAFGPAVLGEEFHGVGRWLIAFVAGPLAGALTAGLGYSALVLKPQERLFGGRLVDADVPPGRVAGEVESAVRAPGERPIDKLS
jgi:glycerol uptake facilitator protein